MIKFEKFRELPTDIIIDIIKSLIYLGGVTTLGWINQITFSNFLKNYSAFKLPIFVILGLIFIYFLVQIFSISRKKNKPDLPQIESDYFIKQVILKHELKNDKIIEHQRKYILEANRNGLKSFKSKFLWTGGNYKITSGVLGHTIKELGRYSVFDFDTYEVCFRRTLNRGEEIEVVVNWTLEDLEGKAEPFLCSTINDPTGYLKFIIIFDDPPKYPDVLLEEAIYSRQKVLNTVTKPIPDNGRIEWEIKKPKLLYNYIVKW